MAEYYSAELSQKVLRGQRESRLKGEFPGGFILYGYEVHDKRVYINESQAEVVRYIFEQYAAGKTVKGIVEELTARGITHHKNKPFVINTVHLMLQNEKYTGVYHYGGETFNNIYPQIVPREIFDRIQLIIAANRYGSHSPDDRYLLRKKLYCGLCGSTMSGETGTSRNGSVKRYYKCFGRKKHSDCNKQNVAKHNIEALVLDQTYALLSSEENVEVIADKILESYNKRANYNSMLKVLLDQRTEAEKILANVMKAIEQGVVTPTTKNRLNELESELSELEAKIYAESQKIVKIPTKEEIKEYLHKALSFDPQLLINIFIRRVTLYDDRVVITYRIYDESPDDNRGFSITVSLHSATHKHGERKLSTGETADISAAST